MKKLCHAFAIIAALAVAAFGQTPTPPKPAAGGAAPTASAATGGTGAEGKLAYINVARWGPGINELKEKLEVLNAEFAPKQKELEVMEAELNNLKSKIQNQGNTVSAQVRNQWVEEGAEKERQLKRKAEDYQAMGNKRQAEVTQPVYEKISKFLEGYCQQRGIVMLLEGGAVQQTGVVIYASNATDITEDFMAQYNKANPGTGTAAAAPAGAAKKP